MNVQRTNTEFIRFALLAILVLFSCGCRLVEHRILYNPTSFERAWTEPDCAQHPGVCREDVFFKSADGVSLHGWLVYPDSCSLQQQHATNRPVVLFAHGRSGNISELQPQLFEFVERQQVVLMVFDYRGFGKSEGRPSESGLRLDTTAARDWLADRCHIVSDDVVLMGRSLGAAVVVDVACRDGARSLIVESGFTSFADVFRHHSRGILPGKNLRSSYDSISRIGNFNGSLLVSHGVDDKLIPVSHGRALSVAATNAQYVQFVEMPGGHEAEPDEAYHQVIEQFLAR